jgi:hypothetical protein
MINMTRFFKFGCLLTLIFFASPSFAQDFLDGDLPGQTFWVKPAKEIYRRIEFYRQPKIDAPSFFPSSTKQIRIISVGRGWIKLNFVSAFNGFEEAYVPIGYFKRNLYTYATFNSYAFDRTTFFREDPELIKERAEKVAAPEIGDKGKPKSIASKFFRHKKKCCGMSNLTSPVRTKNPPNYSEVNR